MVELLKYTGDTVAVMGLGLSGRAAAHALMQAGAHVLAWDDTESARQTAAQEGIPLHNLNDPALYWEKVKKIIWSPGIPHTLPTPHPVAITAQTRGVPLVCDVDLLLEQSTDACCIAVSGTNGKSTTTALIAHILKAARQTTHMGGNIGVPAVNLPALSLGGNYVLELSSYQLELVPSLRSDVAIVLNISPDHLDRHGGIEGYTQAKQRLLDSCNHPGTAIIGVDDPHCAKLYQAKRASGHIKTIPFSSERKLDYGIYVDGNNLVDGLQKKHKTITTLSPFKTLPGLHNWQNIAAAYAAAVTMNVPTDTFIKAVASFPGLPHRMETVGEINGVRFVNDSKATNMDATDRALDCYDNIHWIAGGKSKEGSSLQQLAHQFEAIAHAYLIGDAMDDFACTLEGKVPYTKCNTLDVAVAEAAKNALADAARKPVVLLAPACASFDQFANFETRGNTFRTLAQAVIDSKKASY
jgi:UDP-N-acetylmuramoylalanine--D-glutamate ligase